MPHCIECERLKREKAELELRVIEMAQRWLELKKFILSSERRLGPGEKN